MVSKRLNLKVHSLARLEGGSVSIAGDVDIDGVVTAVQVVVDSDGWERIARNVSWFRATRNAPESDLAKIIVNGREMEITTRPLSYEDVVNLAGKTGQPTITWRVKNATAGLSSGTMTPDGSFTIVPSDGMVFNVMHTNDA